MEYKFAFFIAVLTVTLILTLVSADSAHEIIKSCKKDGVTCIGYNSPDAAAGSSADCSSDVSKCQFAYASIKPSGNGYKVKLVGQGAGWVSIAFSEDGTGLMREDNLGIVCINGIQPNVQILAIQDRNGPLTSAGQPKKAFRFDNSALKDSISDVEFKLQDGWMVCEFKLASNARHGKRTLDLHKKAYKIGLAGNPNKNIDDSTAESANQPVYHGQTRGSSATKLEIFMKAGGGENGATIFKTGGFKTCLSLVLAILVFFKVYSF